MYNGINQSLHGSHWDVIEIRSSKLYVQMKPQMDRGIPYQNVYFRGKCSQCRLLAGQIFNWNVFLSGTGFSPITGGSVRPLAGLFGMHLYC